MLTKEEDLYNPATVTAAEVGSHQEAQVRQRYPRAQILLCRDAHDAMLHVLQGDADACLADAGVPDFLLLHPECAILLGPDGEPVITSIDYAHPCIRAGDQRFLNWLNTWTDYHTVQGTFERCIARAYEGHETKFARIAEQFEQRFREGVGGSQPAASVRQPAEEG